MSTHCRLSRPLQIGKALGARVIGTVGSAEKVEVAKKAGCDEVSGITKNVGAIGSADTLWMSLDR
jgi:NADPH:quinone reductase-like Zn-dependent oxidoreductase